MEYLKQFALGFAFFGGGVVVVGIMKKLFGWALCG